MQSVKFTQSNQQVLVALIWCLKPSDLSIMQAAIQVPEETQIATTKDSANFIFYSVLQSWGLAQLLPPPKLNIPPEVQKRLNDTQRIFLLNQEAKPILLAATKQALSSIERPEDSIVTKEAADILKIYEREGNEVAKAKLAEIYSQQLEKIAEEKRLALNSNEKIFKESSVHSLLMKPTLLKLVAWLANTTGLFFCLFFMCMIPPAIYMGDNLLLVISIFISVLLGSILLFTNRRARKK